MTDAADSFPARIRIESTAGDERFEETVPGVVYRKAGAWYLRYEEEDEAGERTRVLVKCAEDGWTVTRRGPVEGEIRCMRGRPGRGSYRIGGMELSLTARFRSASLRMDGRRGMIRLEYGLSIGGEPERRHSVTYWIEPV
jgi:uncharacterized beta-barrel protein YwiB (DUF1934 family)